MSQNAKIIQHMKRGSITPLVALRLYGCMRLAARIDEIRDMGHDVISVWVTVRNASGKRVKVKSYSIRGRK